jgi:hypothetical protein
MQRTGCEVGIMRLAIASRALTKVELEFHWGDDALKCRSGALSTLTEYCPAFGCVKPWIWMIEPIRRAC